MKEHFKLKFDDLFNPTIEAMHKLGGSGRVEEIEDQVASVLDLTDEQINEIHKGDRTKFSYRLAWSRNYLKRYGILENSARGVWALTEKGLKTRIIDKDVVKRTVVSEDRKPKSLAKVDKVPTDLPEDEELQQFTWQQELIEELLKIDPAAFERLCQRLLRELGFQNVEVTGRANDGGIDGKGLLKIGGVLSFHVIFQAKRYKGSISPSIVRDFRGAMVGRADKGLIITTGNFTREAKREASRDGAPPIDLMDSNDLAEKLKEMNLGVETELIEKVNIKKDWFKTL